MSAEGATTSWRSPFLMADWSGRWLVAIAILAAAVWCFVYNSDWGYDGLEVLVIGRSMLEGFPFYTFAPSKSFGLYYLVAAYVALPGASTHAGISLLISVLLFLACAATFLVLSPRFGSGSALVGSTLIGVAGLFMELNFLVPEGLVFVGGLFAFAAVSDQTARKKASRWITAGACIGIGMAFKLVAALYAAALITWIPLASRRAGERVWTTSVPRILWTIAGLVTALALPAAFFWQTGRLESHLGWTYVFPLLDYPATSKWAAKLYTKLLWVWIVLIGAVAASLAPRIRPAIYRDDRVWLLLLLGVWALVPLLKSQSSHFAFPGAAFLLLYAAVVYDMWAGRDWTVSQNLRKPALATLAAVCLLSGAFYWPSAIKRVFGLVSYAREEALRASLHKLVPPDRRAIFFTQGLRFYWVSDRLPNWPILHTDIQATYLLSRRSTDMLKALDDPQLALVEFDPRWTAYGDRRFFERPDGRAFLDELHARLQRGFRRDDKVLAPLVVWTRDSADDQ